MPRTVTVVRLAHLALVAVTAVLLAWLCLLAVHPTAGDRLPGWLGWFGRPGSAPTVAIVVGLLIGLCVLNFRSHPHRSSRNIPITVVAGLAATSLLLGFSSFWNCHDDTNPAFFQPLVWTGALIKGGITEFSMDGRVCPTTTPAALIVAWLAALAAIFTGLAGVVIALFAAQADRIRATCARSVVVAIGIDDDTRPMVAAVAATLDRRSTLVVITGGPGEPGEQEARTHAGRVVPMDLNSAHSIAALRFWRRLERLYLMSPDPSTNLFWLDAITGTLSTADRKQRLLLSVRIDDPWQAEA